MDMQVHRRIHLHVHVHVHIHTHVNACHMHMRMRIHMHTCMHTCAHKYMYIRIRAIPCILYMYNESINDNNYDYDLRHT